MDPPMIRLLVVLALVAAAAVIGAWWRHREGQMQRRRSGRFGPEELATVGLDPGADAPRALLLVSPTCAPCRSVKQVLAEVAQARPDFHWVAVDAADHLDIARTHHVLRVPTLFVVGQGGRILARSSGVPAVRDLLQVVDRTAADVAP